MTAASGAVLNSLLDAWVLSGLFYDYNLVVLVAKEAKQTPIENILRHPCLNKYPQALAHLAIYNRDVNALQAGVGNYLNGQIPPFYFCEGPQDSFAEQAVNAGFLIIALNHLPWIKHTQNGFLFSKNSSKSLALSLISILENPAYDGEVLRDIAHRARDEQTTADSPITHP